MHKSLVQIRADARTCTTTAKNCSAESRNGWRTRLVITHKKSQVCKIAQTHPDKTRKFPRGIEIARGNYGNSGKRAQCRAIRELRGALLEYGETGGQSGSAHHSTRNGSRMAEAGDAILCRSSTIQKGGTSG